VLAREYALKFATDFSLSAFLRTVTTMDIAQTIIDNIVVCRTAIALVTARTIAAADVVIITIRVTQTDVIITDFIILMVIAVSCRKNNLGVSSILGQVIINFLRVRHTSQMCF
jgi:hypothetical protein